MDMTVWHLPIWQEIPTDTARRQQGAPCPLNTLRVGMWAEFSGIVLLSQPALTIFHRHLIITREDMLVSRPFAWCLISSQKGSNSSSWTAATYQNLIQLTHNAPSFLHETLNDSLIGCIRSQTLASGTSKSRAVPRGKENQKARQRSQAVPAAEQTELRADYRVHDESQTRGGDEPWAEGEGGGHRWGCSGPLRTISTPRAQII